VSRTRADDATIASHAATARAAAAAATDADADDDADIQRRRRVLPSDLHLTNGRRAAVAPALLSCVPPPAARPSKIDFTLIHRATRRPLLMHNIRLGSSQCCRNPRGLRRV